MPTPDPAAVRKWARAQGLVSADRGRLPRSTLALLAADAMRLASVPCGPLPILDRWMIVGGGPDLLHSRRYLDGAVERLRLPLRAVAADRPVVWLVCAASVQLEELAALLSGAQRWCDAVCRELAHVR